MKTTLFALLFLMVLKSSAVASTLRPAAGVDLHGWQIEYSTAGVMAMNKDKQVAGEHHKHQGKFSAWLFRTDAAYAGDGFEIIFNTETGIILTFKPNLDAGGPFLSGLSEDKRMIALDYGTAPTMRKLEVWTAEGQQLLEDSYFHKMRWIANDLVYDFSAEQLDLNLNDKTRACEGMGYARMVKEKRFNPRKGVSIGSTGKMFCSNL